jgi:hypothetical protein
MDMSGSVMEILSIGLAGLLADTIGIRPVYYLGGSLLIIAGILGLVLLGQYQFAAKKAEAV